MHRETEKRNCVTCQHGYEGKKGSSKNNISNGQVSGILVSRIDNYQERTRIGVYIDAVL